MYLPFACTPEERRERGGPRPSVGDLKPFEQHRTDAYAAQLEAYLRKWLVEDYPRRAAKAWKGDYSSMEAFMKSVEPNRQRWRKWTFTSEMDRAVYEAAKTYLVQERSGP